VRQKPYDDIKVKKITINELQLNIKEGF
jgi:hypothetical protein